MATSNEKVDWAPFCKELAKKLLTFKDDREPLVTAVRHILERAYENYNKGKTKSQRKDRPKQYTKSLDNLKDIDPFTVFAIFGKKIIDPVRAEIIKAFVADDVFPELRSWVPENIEEDMDFEDMPKLKGTAASFCMSDNLKEGDIDKLWKLFALALEYAKNPKNSDEFIKAFDDVASDPKDGGVPGVKGSKISTGLSWIAPESFMNLSGPALTYISTKEGIPENVIRESEGDFLGAGYLRIIKGLRSYLEDSGLKDFRALNLAAYEASRVSKPPQERNRRQKKEKNPDQEQTTSTDGPSDDAQEDEADKRRQNSEGPEEKNKLIKEFLDNVYLGKNEADKKRQYETLVRLLENKKNLILQGPPGVGKTFAAKKLAYAIIGRKDKSLVKNVQFHQNYSYEDFVEGYKPSKEKNGEFDLQDGVFRELCEKARSNKREKYFLIIDEINRGNLSKIFGELLMLIEKDYRDDGKHEHEITLAYSKEPFSIPENLYIIGMMNTADRNLAMLDYALRRRFAFFDMGPAFDSWGFQQYQKKFDDTAFNNLIMKVQHLNEDEDGIKKDESLGEGFCIGHSYFCGWDKLEDLKKGAPNREEKILAKLRDVVECDILPTLREYWFENKDTLEKWEEELRSVFPPES